MSASSENPRLVHSPAGHFRKAQSGNDFKMLYKTILFQICDVYMNPCMFAVSFLYEQGA